MPTNKQRRQAAQRHLQRQLARRAEQSRRRRRTALISIAALAVLVVLGAVAWVYFLNPGKSSAGVASGTSGASSTPTIDGSDGTCTWAKDASPTGGKNVGTPPTQVPTQGTAEVTMTTNFGPIGLSLDQKNAPCASASMVYLAEQHFFDGTTCHRETSSASLKVLQCGDPTGTGTGGPGYQFKTQVTGKETYPRGTLAMANSGQGFDGSQFFLVYGDSKLPPNYTVLGSIDAAGLGVLDTIAANGNNGANGQGDGAPNKPVTITSMTVQQQPGASESSAPASATAP